MKNQINSLMTRYEIDAIWITGPAQHNPFMVYLTGGGHITQADLILVRGKEPVLFHGGMERDEAARTGLKTIPYTKYPFMPLLKQAEGDQTLAMAYRNQAMLEDLGIQSGRVLLYGQTDLGQGYARFTALQRLMPDIEFVGGLKDDLLLQAMMSKDTSEIERIRRMGEITTTVVGRVAEFLTSHAVREDEVLVKTDGDPLTIGEVKAKIDLWLAELGAQNPEGTIFALGRDAGVPHSTGTASDTLRLGTTIVFDIFPCENGGGYFHDFTRTWCLGYAPDDVKKLYDDVYEVYQKITSALEFNAPFKQYQTMTCELFEAQGHATIKSDPSVEEGYVHSLGHGVGLQVHELPFCGMTAGEDEVLAPGVVIAIEPGLYYPEKGMGVRLEDTYYVNEAGDFIKLVDYPLDLVLPMKSRG